MASETGTYTTHTYDTDTSATQVACLINERECLNSFFKSIFNFCKKKKKVKNKVQYFSKITDETFMPLYN